MDAATVLIVDDEKDLVSLLEYHLTRENYDVLTAGDGEMALELAKEKHPDLILLDIMLPEVNGLEVCKRLKADPDTASIRIIMLTARGEEADIVAGLELGADDYVSKPFSPRVLLARVRAVLRRAKAPAPGAAPVLKIKGLHIDSERYEVKLDGEPCPLTLTEFKLLQHMAQRRGRVFTRYQLISASRGGDVVVVDRTADVHIASLRRKLGDYGDYIETVRGIGYRFRDE
jgi:DNA-binding response OmpR family regulator